MNVPTDLMQLYISTVLWFGVVNSVAGVLSIARWFTSPGSS